MMRPHILFALLFLMLLTAFWAAGCSGCGEMAHTTEARTSFIESLNDEALNDKVSSKCHFTGSGSEVVNITYTCSTASIDGLEQQINNTCSRFQFFAFEKMNIIGQGGKSTCNLLAEGCPCTKDDAKPKASPKDSK